MSGGSRFQLSTDRLALLRALRSEKGLGGSTREAIPRRPEGESYPLSFGQERLWFLDRLNPGAAAYNLRAALRLDGPLDPAALERAVAALVARQTALATIFATVLGEHGEETPVQRLAPPGAPDADRLRAPLLADLSALPPARRERTFRRLAGRETSRPFDLERGPLLRVSRVLLGADSQALVIAVHHIATDGWSMDLMVRELFALYQAELTGEAPSPAALPTLPIRYVDFAAWQRERAAAGALDGELAAWSERLAGAPLVLDLPTDRPRPTVPSFRGGIAAASFSGPVASALSALARRAEATPFMLLLALFGLTLRRHADPGGALADVLIGTPIANRQRPEVANLIGFFANTLVMRVGLAGDPTFLELLARVRGAALAAQAHQDLPFERLVEALHPERTLDRTPIFQAMLVVDHAPGSEAPAAPTPGAPAIGQLIVPGGSARFDLTLAATVGDGAFFLGLEYAADLFDGATVRRWLGRFAALAEAAVSTPEAPVSRLSLLPAAERHQTLCEWNSGPWAEGLPAVEPRLDRWFAAAVAAGPERLAVSCAGTVWTYAELAAQADRVRSLLAARCDFGPEKTVALALRRSPTLIAAILGTLAADAAYLPLDPETPDERIAWTIADSQAALVLVDAEERDRFATMLGEDRVLVLSEGDAEASELPEPVSDRLSDQLSDRLAYVLYTSGSTGRPKGVMVSHRAACATLLWRLARFSPGPGDVMLQNISTTFDPSVWQIFGALLSGARLALLPPEERKDFAAIARRLASERGTITDLAPSMLRAFLDQDGLDDCQGLRLLFAGGEALPPALAAHFAERFPAAALHNIYGPTEVAIDAADWAFEPRPGATAVPIGRPAAGKRLFVLDARLQPVPIGAPGELYVGCLPATSGGGGGLARGYLGSPDLTAERFVPNRFAGLGPEDDLPGSRLYRTGDLVRLLADGVVDFLGRVDRQVKVRGFRIELGEVEAAIVRHPGVREAYAAARERGGEAELAVWFAPDWPGAVAEVRARLAADLPAHLVPAAFCALGALPRNASGKVDAGALPEPSAVNDDARPFRPPGGALESAIAEIWREVLGREQVGVDDNFFDLGGHSLLLVRVHGRLRKLLGREVPIVDLFAHPTVAALAAHLSPPDREGADAASSASAAPKRRPRRPEAETDHAIAIVAVAGRFPGAADVEQLWRNLLSGRDSIRSFSAEELLAAGHAQALIDRPDYVRARGAIDDVDLFDAGFFGLGAREAELLDPQHRLFLEVAWEALERAGRDPGRGGPIGVFAGTSVSTYLLRNVLANPMVLRGGGLAQAHLGADKDFLATRASYLLDLKGPSLAVQTACSTSLVAVHLACRSLRDRECDLALAGGVSIAVPQVEGYLYQEGGILSQDGRCRPFDAAAAGTVSGSGVGFVVLERLADALANGRRIVAVIRGSAINNDGAAKVGYTAPGIEGQASAIAAALADAGVEPAQIGYVEAHGTATPLGDPIEIAALGRAFGGFESDLAPGSIPIGSIKSNIGHLDAAAGVAGLIKAALALEREEIPPSLHFERPNPRIDLPSTPFRVAAERTPWPRGTSARFAGVSSFGIGGTNVHVVLEEPPMRAEEPAVAPERAAQLLLWSAQSDAALDATTGRLAEHLTAHPDLDLAAVAFTLAAGRKRFGRRAALVAHGTSDAAAALAARDPERLMFGGDEIRRSVAFLLPGQGAQRFAMGAGLYAAEPVFRAAFDECAAAIDPHLEMPVGLMAALGLAGRVESEAASDEVRDTALAQPALFALEVALARLWESWGVRPTALLGHSIGEYAAAHLAGVFTLADAGRVVALRGRLMSALPTGAMLGVPLGEEATRAMLAGTDLDLAAVNGPELSVVSGTEGEIAAFTARLAERGLEGRRLRTSHAFHSRLMEPILAPFLEILRSVELAPPRLPFLSNLTGDWISPAEATDPGYWVSHLRQPVRFGDGLKKLLAQGKLALLEVGPGRALISLARRQTTAATPVIASLGGEGGAAGEPAAMLGALGRLWLAGVEVAAEEATGSVRRKIVLPTYPFQRRRYWIDPAPAARPQISRREKNLDRLPAPEWLTVPVWREVPAGANLVAADSVRDWLLVADRLGLAERLADRLRSRGDRTTLVREGEPLDAFEELPARVVHLANVTAGSENSVEATLDRAFHDLAALARTYGEKGRPLDLSVVADGLCDVAGEGRIQPVKTALLGLVRALPLESPGTTCRALDVLVSDSDRVAESLLAELDRSTTEESDDDRSLVALRRGRRFVRAFERLTEKGEAAAGGLRAGGVVLVTGGTSGLGLEIAGHLARTRGAKLVLVGRTAKSTPLDGSEVLTLAADVAEPEAMRWVVERALERFGALHGVIHAAGIPGGGVVQLRERAAAEAVLAPKVQGTLALAAAVANLPPLDLFVVCSSLAALFGGAGQSDYAAANAVLDAFAESERAAGRRVLAIDWDAWREVGMAARAVDPKKAQEQLDGLATAEGLAAFDRAVGSGQARVVVSTRDLGALRARFRPAEKPAAAGGGDRVSRQLAFAHERPALATAYLAPRDATERALTAVWQEVLGVGPIGVHDDFTELGGHSLLALQVVARIRRDLAAELPLAALFTAPTIARLALKIAPKDATAPTIEPDARADAGDFPLSFAQERLWFIDRLEPGQAAYHMPGAVRLAGALDERVLAAALAELAHRHAVLRTTFPSAAGRPVQRVSPSFAVPLPVLDLSALGSSTAGLAASRAMAQAQELGRRPFDLERGPVFRALLLRVSGVERILAFALHHIVSDGGSMRVIQQEVGRLYAAFIEGKPSPLPPLPLSYGEYARRERAEMAEGGRLAEELQNRTERLTPLPVPLDLPADRARPNVQTFRGTLEPFEIPSALTRAVRAAARRGGVTPFMLLLAAFSALIRRLSGRTDFALGTAVTNRDRMDTEGMIGLFVNTIVLRLDLSGDPSFDELLARVREESVAAFSSAALPFERLISALSPERDLSRSPLFQVLFAFQGAGGESAEVSPESVGATLDAEPLALDAGRAMFDWTLTLDDAGARFQGGIEYATDLFDRTRIRRTVGQLLRLLDAAVAEPSRRLADLTLLSAPERHQLLTEWEGEVGADGAGSMLERFFHQAERRPEAVALIWGSERWSYGDLFAKARGIAHRLRTEYGVGPESVVGISAGRTPLLIAGLLGILEAGAAYLPLDPAYPDERLAFMLADAHARAALVDGATSGRLAALAPELRRLDLSSVDPEPALSRIAVDAGQLAYLIYTSGSTGRPKGVAIEHRSAGALLDWAGRTFSAADLSGVLAATSIAFDLSVFEIFAPLSFGGAVILAEDALALRGLPAFGEVTLINTVPSALAELLRGGAPPSLSVVCVAGEPLPRSLVDAVHERWGCDNVWNLYGPSEDSTYSTGVRVPAGMTAPTIGRPLAGSRARILDDQGAVLPQGVPGELYLAGAGLARGYYGRPDLTAERFVPDPFGEKGARLYRTGDLARFRSDGELEYLGRIDGQVKIRGFRIELGEVEAALRALPGVVDAAVLATPDRARLVAFVVASPTVEPRFDEWRAALGARLPGHFVPSLWRTIEALPRTINGKVDRRALATLAAESPSTTGAAKEREAALDPLEELVASVWAEVLELPAGRRVGPDDDFFALGGHSLLAAQTLARLGDACGVELAVRALFEAPTVAGLAARIEAAVRTGEGTAPLPPIERLTRGEDFRPPLSFGQLRLWFLDRLEPDAAGRAAYNLPAALRLSGALAPAALAAALSELVRRHEALRTSFRIEGEEPFQAIADPAPIRLPFCDLTGFAAGAAAREARRLADLEVRRPFDLGEGPLLRALLIGRSASQHDLILTLHHAASDGASMSLLERELPPLYAGAVAGRPSPFPDLPIQYADYAAWQRELLSGETLDREVSWWRTLLSGAPPRLDLPTDHPRPRLQTFRGGQRARLLARPEVLRRLARELSATPYMVALAAWGALLGRAAGQSVVVVGSPISNRPRPELERLIGFFANTLALPVDLSGDPPFSGLVERVRAASLGAFAHSAVPFEKLVEQLAPARDLAGSPLFQTLLSFQAGAPSGAGAPADSAATLRMAPIAAEVGSAKFDLTLALQAAESSTVATLEWNADLFDPATALRLLDRFERLLAAAAEDGRSSVSQLPLLAPAERQQVLIETNDSARPLPERVSALAEIARTAAGKPDAVAIQAGGEHLSYGELMRRSRRLGAKLRRDFAVGDDSVVAIALPRTPAQLVGLLAILEAGGAYLPLDPTTPAERLAFLLADARAKVLVTETGFLAAPVAGTPVLPLDREEWADEPGEIASSVEFFLPERIAYVLYTSGSTGVPKGVAVEQRALANLLATIRQRPGLSERDVLLGVTGLWFDIASVEMLLPLLVGARLELVDRAEAADGGRLLARLTECGATVMQATPGTWRILIDAGWSGSPPLDVRSTGEALPPALAAELVARSARVWNLYGPTETTIYSSLARVESSAVAIGRPVGNTELVVAETGAALGGWFGEPASPGALGELLIGGSGVARGYLGRPDLTAERFVPDPFSGRAGARAYRSGDRVRALPNGDLLYLGRGDFQVKIRGFRIELAEIEAALEAHPQVAEAVVVARSAPRDAQQGGEDGDLRLVAYVVAAGEPSLEALRDHLRGKLPSHMVPWAFVPLAALPRNRNGKVDRGVLPAPERAAWSGGVAFEEPRTETERRIAAIWCAALRQDRVGADDNFFDSGGHSLLAVRVHQRLRAEFGRELPLVALFAHPTIRSLARFLSPGVPVAGADGQAEVEVGGQGEAAERGRDRGFERRQAAATRRGARGGRSARSERGMQGVAASNEMEPGVDQDP